MTTEIVQAGTGVIVPIQGFELESNGMVLHGHPTYPEWEAMYRQLAHIHRANPLWLGDMLNVGEGLFNEDYAQAIDTGIDPASLANYKSICKRVAIERRPAGITISHMGLVAAMAPEDQDHWLHLTASNDWRVSELRAAIREEAQKLTASLDAPPHVDDSKALHEERVEDEEVDQDWQPEQEAFTQVGENLYAVAFTPEELHELHDFLCLLEIRQTAPAPLRSAVHKIEEASLSL